MSGFNFCFGSIKRFVVAIFVLAAANGWALDSTLIRTKISLSSYVAGHANTTYTFNGTVKNLAGSDITTSDYFTVTFPIGTVVTGATGTLKTTGQPQGLTLSFGTDGLNRPFIKFVCPTPIATKKRFTLTLDGIKNPDPAGAYSAIISAENSSFDGTSGHDTALFPYTIVAGPASKLGFVQSNQPANPSYRNRTISPPVLVAVQDAVGNTITTSTATITLGITPGTGDPLGFLSGTLSKQAVLGVADFSNLSINLNSPTNPANPYKLRATTTGGISLADSAAFDVIDPLPNYLSFTTQPPANAQAGDNLTMQVTVLDGFTNNPVTSPDFNITLRTNPSAAIFPGGNPSFSTITVNGVATFNVNVHQPGTYIFSASTTNNTNGANSNSTIITAGAASALTFLLPIKNTEAGRDDLTLSSPSPILSFDGSPVEVGVTDAYGNIIPNRTDTVTIVIDPGTGTPGALLSGNLSATAGNAASQDTSPPFFTLDSVALFDNLNINLVGDYKLRAQAPGLSDGTSNTFKITPEAASILVVSGIDNPSKIGVAKNVTVTAQDEFGNVDTNYRGTITFSANDLTTTFPTNYPFIATDNGQHTFLNGVVFNTVGTAQSVSATDTQISTITGSQSVLVTKGDSSTTVLSATPNPSGVNQDITFTAQVTGAGVTPTGTVTFYDNVTALGPPSSLDGTGKAIFVLVGGLSLGTHTMINAVYNADLNYFGSSSGNYTQTVVSNTSTTTLGSGTNPSTYGQAVLFTATVNPSAGPATGTVTFKDGTTVIGTGNVTGSGPYTATFTTASLSAGSHNISAVYNGDANVGMSTSGNVSQTVNAANTTTAVISSVNPSVNGQGVIFTATISAVAPGGGTPTGNVIFTIDGQAQGPSALVGNSATFNTANLAPGNHSIDAAYNGDTNFNPSSAALNGGQSVNKDNSTTTVNSAVNPSEAGQAVTVSVTISAASPGSGTPSGNVIFVVDGTSQPAVTLSGGHASLGGLMLSFGNHTVSASYSGDTRFNSSSGNLANGQTVGDTTKPSVTTPFSTDVSSGTVGQVVTFTWGVSDSTTLTYTFDFGDGTVLTTSNPTVTHTFTVPSTFPIKATATDLGGNTIDSTLSFNVSSNAETSTDLCGPNPLELKVKQIQARVKFPTQNKDSLSLKGTIQLPDNFVPLGQVVQWEIGGVSGAVTLNVKSSSAPGNVTASIKFKKPTKGTPFTSRPGSLSITMKNQSLSTFALGGIVSTNTTSVNPKGDPATIECCVLLKDKQGYHANSQGLYKAKKDKGGQFSARFK